MTDEQRPRPLLELPVASGTAAGAPPPRHETVLPEEPPEAAAALARCLEEAAPAARLPALEALAASRPAFLEAWARLSETALEAGERVRAYAFARVAYHRGLDALRRNGWGGTGMVRWARPSNRGFLRGLRALLAAAASLDEAEESARCRQFLLDLDPEDGAGAAGYPEVPGPGWSPPPLP